MSVLAELSLFPVDKGESLSPYVTRMVRIIKNSGLDYTLHSMGTCLEGEWPEVMDVVDKCFQDLQQDCGRIYLTLKVDYRSGGSNRLTEKVESVHRQLGEQA
ncbi:protein of unknown function DUF77 [Desulfonatronospira thiodismutans ASO3-1]|uniref:Thiamine-binding protein domain-containing protein n=1 Tax=Desulfonatronospira thiodismutans ASO3-1 TaxID=555779 RepID=D6SRH0_9BACT|nr:MTH1187 family thiamine-binding protein [Desulfonatronospira thiodismutans]EFI33286.1 protein of unknown function DUF77 [Desulfonatronospira thiodismutans ASO3-1]